MNPLRFPSRALRLIGPADREPAAASRKPLRRATHLRSLEQRFMFDGAAVGDAAHAVANHDAAVHDVVVPAAVEVRTADPAKDSGRKEVVFVDTSVSGYKTLEAGIPAGMSIVEIDGSQNGLAQIANWAQTHTGFDAIHILSHGTEGMLELGTAFVNDAALHSSGTQAELADIGHALKSGGDLLLYGCDVAAGSDGRQFVDDLSAATGHDVAASTDATGAAAKGGNWTLEAQVGHIDAATLDIGSYTDTLGNVVTGNDPGAAYGNTNTISPSAPTDLAQSFTATKTGLLTTLTLYGTLPSGTATLNVYSGDGTGGALLETQSLSPFNAAGTADTGNNRYIATNITLTTPVNITNGNVYTFQITTNDGISLTYTNNADYAGGTLYDTGADQGSSYDLMFDATQSDANSAPSNTVAPVVSGTQTVGNVLSATTGTWNDADNDALTYSYQWYRADDSSGTNAVAIGGATGSSYTLTTSDAHEYVRVVVTADDGNSHTPTANSSWTAVNDAAPANSAAPSLSGTATVGNALSATTGTWSDADGDSLTYSYQWYRADDGSGTNAVAIGGATGSSYTLSSSDGNEFVRVVVTANDGHGSSNQTAASSWTSVATVPSVSSIVRTGGASSTVDAGAGSMSYTVTFSESVTGVDASDFALTETGTASGSIASVSGSGTTYTVTVDTLSGDGTMRLDLNGSGTGIQNASHVDIAGGYTSGSTYTLDHTAPNAPSTPDMSAGTDSGSSNTDNITSNTTPTFTGTAESGSTVTLYDTDGTTVLGTTTAAGGSWSITSSSLSDGSHTLSAKSTDAAGNVSSASSGLSVTIDTSAPSSLGLSATTIASSSATSGSAIATLSATDGQAITYSLAAGNGTNDADNGSFTIAGTSLEVGGASLTAGTYKIYVAATDTAGNVANQAFTITIADAPSVSSIVRTGGASSTVGTSATSVQYTVTFDQSVTGVDASDFALTETGTASGSIASVSGSGTTYTVTVDTLSGDGTMRLDLNGSGTGIQNGSSVDIAGGYTSGATYTVDHTAPNAPSTPDMSTGTDSGSSNTDNITSNTTPTFTGTAESGSTVTLYDTDGTTVLGTTTATGGSWSITSSSLSDGSHTLTAKSTDAAGNVSSGSSGLSVTIDATAPVVSSVSVPSNGAYKAGDNLDFTVNLSEAVVVDTSGGTPRVALTIGSSTVYADYVAGSGTSALVFRYTVQNGDTDADGIAIGALQSNGGTLKDTAGNSTTLTLNSVGSTASVLVDTTAPTVTDGHIAISGGSGTGGAYKIGDTVTATWNDTAGGDNNSDILGVTVDFSAFGGGSAVSATNSGGTWTATYTLTAGAIDATNRNVSVTATDNAGNTTTTADTGNATVDNVAPAATDGHIAISGGSGTGGAYKIGDTVTVSWNNTAGGDNNSDTISAVTVDFSAFGGGAAVSATNSGGTWTATYTITSGAIDATNRNVSVTTTDNAGNTTTTADTSNATVDNIAPTITDGNIAISGGSGTGGAYKIGDTVTATWNNTAGGDNDSDTISAVTVDFSAFGGGFAVTATNSGGTWTATYTITSGAIDATNRNVSVTATDNAGNTTTTADTSNATVDNVAPAVTDGNITISGGSGTGGAYKIGDTITATWNNTAGGDNNSDTVSAVAVDFSAFGGGSAVTATNSGGTWTATYTLTAGAINGASGRNVSVSVVDNAGNATSTTDTTNATVDNAAPTVTVGNIALSNDTGSSNTDFVTNTSSQTITATLSSALSGSDVLYGSLDNGATWSDITSQVSGTTLSWAGVSLAGSNTLQLKVTDGAGNDGSIASQAYTLDSAAPGAPSAPHLSSGSDTGSSSSNGITGDTTPTFTGTAEAGSTVTLYDTDGTTVLGTTTATGGNWSITSGALSSGSHAVSATATDAAGNVSSVSSGLTVTIDSTAPAVTSVSGPADGSYKTGDTLSFTVDTGEAVTVDTSGGAPRIAVVIGNATVYATYASGSGSNALVFHYTVQPGDIDTDGITVGSLQANGATLRDTAGNDMDLTLHSVGSTTAVRVGDSATPPSITIGHLALSADTGASSSDFVTRTASQTLTATLSAALGAGDKVYGSLDNGATWTELTSHVSGTSLTWSGVTLAGTNTLQLKVTDGAGNDGAVASHAYTLDTTPPVAPVADAQATTSTAPTLTGTTSLGTGDTLTVAVGGASYRVVPGSDGRWQLDLSSVTPISGTLALASGSRYAVTATTTDVAGNTSTATASLDILLPTVTAPVPAPVPAPVAVEAPSAPAAAPAIDAPPPVPAPISFLSPAAESVLATNPVSAALSPTLSPVSLLAPDYTAVTHALLDPAASAQADAPVMLTRGDANSFRVVVTSAGNDGATGEALLLNRGMSDQSLQASGSGEISVPADAFAHTDPNATIQLSAMQADGQPLPQWIAFDPHTGKFEVHAPHGVNGDVVIKLVAHDAQGHEATAVFKIHLGGKRHAAHGHALATPSARASLSEQVRMAARAHTPIAALERLAEGHPDAREVPWPNA
jgi:hypothetical protein